MATNRNLGIISVTTLLVSSHYGLGFLLGTAEKSFLDGASGSLYAVSIGFGMIVLSLLARFYWNRINPIWTLLGDRYGSPVKIGIGIMSWVSLIGIAAAQIILVAAIMSIAGFPKLPTMISIAACFGLLSLLPMERASWLFRGLLLLNILVLIGALWQLDSTTVYGQVVLDFVPGVGQLAPPEILGIFLSTLLLVLIDMKCQQFVVRSQSANTAIWGCIFSGLILTLFAFLPTALVTAAQQSEILPPEVTGKTIIPYILSWLGGGTQTPLGILLIASLALPALGLGSNILRIQTKAALDITGLAETPLNRIGLTIINTLLAFSIALRGGEIVELIVCFYAAYLSAVWVPFLAYLLEQGNKIVFSITSVRFALGIGGIAALLSLGVSLFRPTAVWFNNPELTILMMGLGFGSITLLGGQIIDTLFLLFKPTQEQ